MDEDDIRYEIRRLKEEIRALRGRVQELEQKEPPHPKRPIWLETNPLGKQRHPVTFRGREPWDAGTI